MAVKCEILIKDNLDDSVPIAKALRMTASNKFSKADFQTVKAGNPITGLKLSSRDNLLSHYAARYLGTNCSVCLHTGAYGLHPHSARRRS